ncbi:hypothetical protein FSP39_001923 [Pinctada imbricata]|uniref:ATP-binding cassette sub-family B member 6, mitochondrial n=1 Tax=Pinctada imbricata TaxID=66713 RepID=A0AA88YGY8_PINIB|nr:hypothetical protein FSP39_001923 [Pinctada imbricata]
MKWCDHNFTGIWVYSGMNRCFQEVVSTTILLIFMLTAGCYQCSVYKKSSKRIGSTFKPTSIGLFFQVLLTLLLIAETLIHIILLDTTIGTKEVFGYELYEAMAEAFVWIASLRLLFLERDRALPNSGWRGHGAVLLIFWTLAFVKETLYFISWNNKTYFWQMVDDADYAEFSLWFIRIFIVSILLVLGFVAPSRPRSHYNIFESIHDEKKSKKKGRGKKSKHMDTTWANIMGKVVMMAPYVWPKGSICRQMIVFFCVLILVAGRITNLFVPMYAKAIIDSLSPTEDPVTEKVIWPVFRWDLVLIWALLNYLKGGGTGSTGFLNNARAFLWIRVQQYTTRKIQLKFLTHIHGLSLRWHLERKTGEVLRVVDRGTKSINNLLNYVVFNVFPTLADVIVAIVYFVTAFDYIFGIIVLLTMGAYLAVTIWITEWRTKFRRDQNKMDNETNQTAVDSLLNFETVKYYGASEWEVNRYDQAIVRFQTAEWKSNASLNLLSALQNFFISGGLLAGSLLCAYAVTADIPGVNLTVGDYILFGTYLVQLYGPLNWLGSYYRMIQQAFIDMENMFELLDEKAEIEDKPGALDLRLPSGGEICFKDVYFSYEPQREVLHGISFTVPAGKTYALVKQNSLRQNIGVVPQDTVLFNADIKYNIRYGNVNSPDIDVVNAAEAADIHDRIQEFPDAYETVVGERGLKLSGGEKQRVAIARTILKNPAICLLDEATSALDTRTERIIQTSLDQICQNRTTLIVAHRLSTIIHADQILVFKDGHIIEKGT